MATTIPFPLIAPVDEENSIYQGYIPIHDTEYQVLIQLGPNGKINGEKKLLDLIQDQQQLLQSKLHQSTDIMSFLTEFKEFIETSNQTKSIEDVDDHRLIRYDYDRYAFIHKEVDKIGYDKVKNISDRMDTVTFETIDGAKRKHFLQVALPANYPFVFPQVKCQLPVKIQVSSSSLPQIYSHHQQLIHKYQPLFNCLDDLDQNMKILEPDQPNRSDVWRRIALGYHCSLEIELNPDAPMDAKPKVRFFGNLSRVKDLKNKWANSEWNKDGPIHTNLLSIFQMVKSQESNATEDYTNKHDVECGICYAYKLNDTSTPDIICTNQSCIRGFHYQCLYEWLRGDPTTTQSFNVLFGKCPYCSEKITIQAKLS